MGVRRISPALVVTRCAARSTVNEFVSTVTRSGVGGDAAAQCGADAREEFVHAERFGDVVIGAGVESGDLLLLRVSRGQDEDGCGEPAPEAAHDVDPVQVGQAEVEDDQVGWVGAGRGEGGGSVVGGGHDVAARAQVDGECAGEADFVVHDQDVRHCLFSLVSGGHPRVAG